MSVPFSSNWSALTDAEPPDYSISPLAVWFHAWPRFTFSFDPVRSEFDGGGAGPSDSSDYAQSIGFWALVPVAFLLLEWIVLLTYFCARCCEGVRGDIPGSSAQAARRRRRRSKRIGCCKAVLAAAALAMAATTGAALFFNDSVDRAMGAAQDSVNAIEEDTSAVKRQLRAIVGMLDDQVDPLLRELADVYGGGGWLKNETVRRVLKEALRVMEGNVTDARDHMHLTHDKVSNITLTEAVAAIESAEYVRWAATIGLHCWLLALTLALLYALLTVSKRCLVWFAALASTSGLLLAWAETGVYVGGSLAVSDFCMTADTYLMDAARRSSIVDSGILAYYLDCDPAHSDNPFAEPVQRAETGLKRANRTVAAVRNVSEAVFPKSGPLLTNLTRVLNATYKTVDSAQVLLDCMAIHKAYTGAMAVVCGEAVPWAGWVLLAAAAYGAVASAAVLVASCTWRHVRVLRHYYVVADDGEEDPFVPRGDYDDDESMAWWSAGAEGGDCGDDYGGYSEDHRGRHQFSEASPLVQGRQGRGAARYMAPPPGYTAPTAPASSEY